MQNSATFIKALVDDASDEALVASWREAMAALDDIQKYPFDATKRGKKLGEVAKNARILGAWQASAVGSEHVSKDVLALLVIDASAASIDALLPHFERAMGDPVRLRVLDALARYETAATAPLFARIRTETASQRAASPVLAFGEKFGLAKNGRFKLTVKVRAKKPAERHTYDFVSLVFDSNEPKGFWVNRGQETLTAGSSSMWQRGVTCTLANLPKAIAKAARDAKVEWDFKKVTTKPLGPAKAVALIQWLAGS